jgi:hypothetical protein
MSWPSLKLLWSPGHVLAYGHAWRPGELLAIPRSGLDFGGTGEVRVEGINTPHCSLDGRLMLRHPHAEGDYSMVNGRPQHEGTLAHRDLLELPRGTLFRVLERDDIEARSPTLEAAMEANPDDDELVHVWSDFLLDQGDPLGERIAKARAGVAVEDAQWLDALAPHYEMGRLEVAWKNGLAQRVVLRDTESGFSSLKQALELLLSLRVMRYLRELVVDVSSDRITVKDGLTALGAVTLPGTVTRLSLGDIPEGYRAVAEVLLPTFGRPVDIGFFRGAQLEVLATTMDRHAVGERIEVGDGVSLGPLGMGDFGPMVISYRIRREGSRYRLTRQAEDAERPKIRGKPVDEFPLRDGDIIELGNNLTVRFTLVKPG